MCEKCFSYSSIFICIFIYISIKYDSYISISLCVSQQEWSTKRTNNGHYRNHEFIVLKKFINESETFNDTMDLSENQKRVGFYTIERKKPEYRLFYASYNEINCTLSTLSNVSVVDGCRIYQGSENLSTIYASHGLINKFTAHVYEGFLLGVPGANAYGHFMTDNIILMEYVDPKFVADKVLIISSIHREIALDVLPIMGFNLNNNVLLLEENEAIFVDKLYTFAFNGFLDLSGPNALFNFAKRLRIYANVDDKKPTDYLLVNRKPGLRRCIIGFDHLVETIKTTYPLIPWKVYISAVGNLVNQVKIWAMATFVFGPSGSNFFNIIFMSSRTVALIFRDPTHCDVENNVWGVIAGVWVLQIPYVGWEGKHFEVDTNQTTVNETLALEFIGHSLDTLKNQHLPKQTSLYNAL